MTIIVAPATLFQPGTTVTEDVYGDSDGTIANTALTQTIIFDAAPDALVAVSGDADEIEGTGRGGDDRIEVHNADRIGGDALFAMWDASQGGDDHIVASGVREVAGDGFDLQSGESQGGDDYIQMLGRVGVAYGESRELEQNARGGDDVMIGLRLYGDAADVVESAQGGDDRLYGRGAGAMTPRQIQYAIAAVFFSLGGWCLVAPQSVIDLCIRPDYKPDDAIAPLLIVLLP